MQFGIVTGARQFWHRECWTADRADLQEFLMALRDARAAEPYHGAEVYTHTDICLLPRVYRARSGNASRHKIAVATLPIRWITSIERECTAHPTNVRNRSSNMLKRIVGHRPRSFFALLTALKTRSKNSAQWSRLSMASPSSFLFTLSMN